MKKLLLSMAVALVAMSASAGNTVELKSNFKKVFAPELVKGQPAMVANAVTAPLKRANVMAKADEQPGDTVAVFIYMSPGEEVDNFVNAMELVAVATPDKDIEVTYVDEGGQQQKETITCNVLFPSFGGYNFDVYAYYYYDEEDECNKYLIPGQEVMTSNGTFSATAAYYPGENYEFHYSIIGLDEPNNGSYNTYANVVLSEDPEDGTLSFDFSDGWGLFIEDKLHADYSGIALAVFDCEFNKPNAKVFYSYTNSNYEWIKVEGNNAYVEDYGAAVVLNGFYGTKLNMRFDEQQLVHMPLGQPLLDRYFQDDDFDYGTIHTIGVKQQLDDNGERSIVTDFDKTENIGTCPVPYVIEFDEYMRGMSNLTKEGMGYGGTFFYGPTIVLNDTYFVAGISDATKAPANILGGKTYNLMGQQVNRTQKGIVVRNGRKYLNK